MYTWPPWVWPAIVKLIRPGIAEYEPVVYKVIDATKLKQGSPTTTIKPGALLANFLAYQEGFLGGVRVAYASTGGTVSPKAGPFNLTPATVRALL